VNGEENGPVVDVGEPKDLPPYIPLMMSDTEFRHTANLNELAAALAKAQSKMGHARKNEENPFFKSSYADLASIVSVARAPLAENGIAVLQGAFTEGEKVSIRTRLIHSSGQWIECCTSATARDAEPQAVGSVITYLRRYGLSSMVNVATEDDDGAQGKRPDSKDNRNTAAPSDKATEAQRKKLWAMCNERSPNVGVSAEYIYSELLKAIGRKSKDDILKSDVDSAIKWIEQYDPAAKEDPVPF
jgi:hypothetical protein